MTDRKKPGMAFWVAVVVVVLALYVLSFGPACWITSRTGGDHLLPTIYRPVVAAIASPSNERPAIFTMPSGPNGGRVYAYPRGLMSWYATVGAAPGWKWRYSTVWEHVWEPVKNAHKFRRTSDWQWEWCDASH
jgi:hypothetical protein